MKKKKPDPRQISLDLGFPDEPASPPETTGGAGLGARFETDWESLQEQAPEASPTATSGSRAGSAAAMLPPDPDAWTEPADLCPIVKPEPAMDPATELTLPKDPAEFILPTSIAWAGRRPYSQVASLLEPGEPVRLVREPDNPHDPHAIRIVNRDGEAAGYVYADEAAWLSLLLDVAPPERDESVVTTHDGRHVHIEIRLHLAEAWPLFTIIAIFGLRSERFASAFNLAGNPFLRPLSALNRQFLANYDYFQMPQVIVDAYASLRQRFDELK